MHRRTFVATASTATAIGLAGCLHDGGGGGSGSPEGAVEAYFTSDSASDARDHLHPDAPKDELANESDTSDNESEPDVSVNSTEVLAEDIDGSYLEEENLTPSTLSIDEVNSVASDETVTIVDATLEFSTEQGTQEFTISVLTATDSGSWYVLDTVPQDFGV